jgi:hypothetical protein
MTDVLMQNPEEAQLAAEEVNEVRSDGLSKAFRLNVMFTPPLHFPKTADCRLVPNSRLPPRARNRYE